MRSSYLVQIEMVTHFGRNGLRCSSSHSWANHNSCQWNGGKVLYFCVLLPRFRMVLKNIKVQLDRTYTDQMHAVETLMSSEINTSYISYKTPRYIRSCTHLYSCFFGTIPEETS